MTIFELVERFKPLINKFGAKTLKIGLEDNLNPDDFPFVRIEPNLNSLDESDAWAEDIYFDIYIGVLPQANYEECLKKAYKIEADIKYKLHNYQFNDGGLVRFIRTQRDYKFEHFVVLKASFKCESFRLF